jgi:hypothetical protein
VTVASAESFYVFEVLSSTSNRRETLSEATPAIRQNLLRAGQQQRIRAFTVAYRQRWKRRTTCEPGYVIAECRDGPPLSSSAGH